MPNDPKSDKPKTPPLDVAGLIAEVNRFRKSDRDKFSLRPEPIIERKRKRKNPLDK